MRKQIKLIALFMTFTLLIAGCNGNKAVVENGVSEQDSENEILENSDGEIQYDKDLKYKTYIKKNVATPSDDEKPDKEEKETNSNSKDDYGEIDPEMDSYKGFNYAAVDTMGLTKETLDLFAPCALYLQNGTNTSGGDVLSSSKWGNIRWFMFEFLLSKAVKAEMVHDYPKDGNYPLSKQWRIKYDEWEYLLREVLNENDPQKVRDMMATEFLGEMEVYYNSNDNYIYVEIGTIGWGYEYAEVRDVKREGDAYIITYDLFTSMSPDEGPYSVVEVTIAESGNKYGYSLVSVDVIKELIKGVDDSVRNEM